MIADDHALFIEGVIALLADEEIIEFAGTAPDGKQLLSQLNSKQFDLILLDLNMPGINGLDLLPIVKSKYPSIKILCLSTYNELHLIKKARERGANGYLIKNCTKQVLLDAISTVMMNLEYFPVTKLSISDLDIMDPIVSINLLTKREREIIGLIKEQFTNQQIADRLYLSVFTVETHRKNIMHKLKLKTPNALIKFIYENGL